MDDDPGRVERALGRESLERAVRAAGIAARPVWYEEVGSTNDEAQRLAEHGAPEWTVVAAGHQTEGRGRLGRAWVDTPGSSLLFSLILRPRLTPLEAPLLSLLAAVEMIAAIDLAEVRSKWPNDLVVQDRKIGGILLDARSEGARLRHVVLGVGINVAVRSSRLPPEVRDTATSTEAEGSDRAPDDILAAFLRGFVSHATEDSFIEGVVRRYEPLCSTIGQQVRATTINGSPVEGVASGLSERGDLIVRADEGTVRIGFGEVLHLGRVT